MYPHACAHWHQHTCNTHTHVHTHIIHTNTHTHPHTHICMHSTTYPIAVITHFITDMVDEAPVDVEHVDSTPRVKLHHFVLTAGHLLHFLCQHNQPSCLVNNRVNRKLSASAGQNWKNVCESLARPVQMLWLKKKKTPFATLATDKAWYTCSVPAAQLCSHSLLYNAPLWIQKITCIFWSQFLCTMSMKHD